MIHLRRSLLVFISMSLPLFANAQQAKVIKVKGQQAIVQFPNGVPPVVGEMIPVGGEAQTESGARAPRANRAHLLGVSGLLAFTNSSATSNTTTDFKILGRYGWNQEIFEFGPLAGFTYSTTTGQSSRTIFGGGFFDFNFVPNRAGVSTVYGVGATADFGQTSSTTGNSTSTSTPFDLFLGANLKWFGLSDNVALRGDVGFSLVQTSSSIQGTTSVTGLLVLAGLAFYF